MDRRVNKRAQPDVCAIALPPATDSPRQARDWACAAASQWGWEDDGDLALVVTELCSNAMVHVGEPFVLSVANLGGCVHVEVWDHSVDPPVRRLVGQDAAGGRGLRIVAHLAHWGWRHDTGGKVVWADLERR